MMVRSAVLYIPKFVFYIFKGVNEYTHGHMHTYIISLINNIKKIRIKYSASSAVFKATKSNVTSCCSNNI